MKRQKAVRTGLNHMLNRVAGAVGGDSWDNKAVGVAAAAEMLLAVNLSLLVTHWSFTRVLRCGRNLSLFKRCMRLIRQELFLEEEAAAETLELGHDMKQHLVYLRQLLLEDRKDEALDAIEALIGSAGERGMGKSNTGNIAVDALVNHAWVTAAKQHIDFYTKLDSLSGIDISSFDLCVLLGNALDNAMEASAFVPMGQRAVWAEISSSKRCLLISLKNRYAGGPVFKNGQMHKKKAGRGHGMGLVSMKKTAEKLGGTMTIEEHSGIFSLKIWIPCNIRGRRS